MRKLFTLLIGCFFSLKSQALHVDKISSAETPPKTRISEGSLAEGASYFADDITIYVCEGKSRTLTATGGSGTYNWYYNDVLIKNATTNQLTITQPGRYYVKTNGTQSNTVIIIISPKPRKPTLTFTE